MRYVGEAAVDERMRNSCVVWGGGFSRVLLVVCGIGRGLWNGAEFGASSSAWQHTAETKLTKKEHTMIVQAASSPICPVLVSIGMGLTCPASVPVPVSAAVGNIADQCATSCSSRHA